MRPLAETLIRLEALHPGRDQGRDRCVQGVKLGAASRDEGKQGVNIERHSKHSKGLAAGTGGEVRGNVRS